MEIAPSIDNFLHTHKDNKPLVLAGKISITKSIMESEKQSLLYRKRDEYAKLNLMGKRFQKLGLGVSLLF